MYVAILSFALGVCLCQQLAQLPPTWVLGLAAALAVPSWCILRAKLASPLSAVLLAFTCFLLGLGYAAWRAEQRLADQLATGLEGQDVQVSGYIADLPDRGERALRFVFEADERPPGVPARLMLSWYATGEGEDAPLAGVPPLRAGERWQLTLRLRRPHGNFNPAGFDYEGWLFERGIRAVGYVRPKADNRRIFVIDQGFMPHLQHARQVIRERFERALPQGAYVGVLSALAIGDQSAISDAHWQLFRQTGVTHLMSISGLHVTLFAALIGGLFGWAWRRVPTLCLRFPAQLAALLAGALAASFYTLLAGFGVPAQRTLYMLLVAGFALLSHRDAGVLRALLLALLLVMLIDPWAGLSAGFWLSFGAVASLALAGRGAFNRGGRVRAWLTSQWAILVFSLPVLLGIFQQFSLVSPLANLLAIPLISMLVTPLAILYAALPLPSLAELAHGLLSALMVVLDALAALPGAMWQQAAPPGWLVAICVLLAGWSLLPRGVPGRMAALSAFLPLVCWAPLRPPQGELRMTAIDIGQGLAVLVQTASHDLLFDSGPAWGSGLSDSGSRTILPFLRAAGVRKLDFLFVSHNDIDHAGGAASILKGIPVGMLRDSLPPGHALHALGVAWRPCVAGEQWEQDGVRFSVLHPGSNFTSTRDNEMSCVLSVEARSGSILLTGDIERAAETALLERDAKSIRADIILAPHHGSRSSSHADFLAAVAPRYVIFTNGYRNRYGHPHAEVLARYAETGAQAFRSDMDGAVTIQSSAAGFEIQRARVDHARYWLGR